ncbi:DNA-binding response regulator, NarL/FixJ family, contains REC and HTH domains [Thermomonospora echinospora]|uniref:DNA-binding response regulator, NarL/FixJ family, contains REC and HTH domains n=1 Tax=Thermomonospora echinospora TaxID=1992 RepID=A0A1H5TFH6_9ACTN|nr:response regulator transcription factor [Thermomonospora echinospora]SEF61566.1 DNA-binding response regulator, NarL/FixJ family, contains REC and HTH domains [Thermomonospora echinospora]
MSPPVRVLIVDDDALVRLGLSMMLAGADDLAVVGEVADGAEVIGAVNEHRPDVVLMDIRMPRLDGLAATERLRARRDPPEIIIMTTFDTDEHILRAMRAGAGGFLLKHTPPEQIVRAIRQVAAGEPIMSPSVLRRMMSYVGDLAGAPPDPRRERARQALARLSPGERAVAALVGRGLANGEIGRELSMSVATVKAYVSRLLAKLELNNRVQVALLVHDAALEDEPPAPA